MLSRNFRLQKVGNLDWLRKNYNFAKIAFSIDELIVLDVTRGTKDEDRFCQHVKALTEDCFVPIASGGGVRTVEQARKLLHSGADKIIVNSIVTTEPEIINEIASEFGRQCIVASIDVKESGAVPSVWIENGTEKLDSTFSEYLNRIAQLPVGEIYLNSMDRDGTGQGYHLDLLKFLPDSFSLPVIVAGGAGNYMHLAEGLREQMVDAVATAHLFNFVGNGLEDARAKLLKEKFQLAEWDLRLIDNL